MQNGLKWFKKSIQIKCCNFQNAHKLKGKIYSLGPLCHLIAVPTRAVGIWLLHLRVELTTVGEVVNRLEGEGGLVSGEVQRKIHCEEQKEDHEAAVWHQMWFKQIRNRPHFECVWDRGVYVCCVSFLPCTRKQKSFHMSRRVSFVNPSASYSTTPLQYTHWFLQSFTRSYFIPPEHMLWSVKWRMWSSLVDSRSKVAEKGSDVLSPLMVALDDILHLQRTKRELEYTQWNSQNTWQK